MNMVDGMQENQAKVIMSQTDAIQKNCNLRWMGYVKFAVATLMTGKSIPFIQLVPVVFYVKQS